MGKRLFLATAIIHFAGLVHADNPFPAVNLPAVVPNSVRDQTARALAQSRDQLGWAVHPFRGEFHGLGVNSGSSSEAYDLSANGRVVVGANQNEVGMKQGYVWSPWTGRATYDFFPSEATSLLFDGSAGEAVPTAISADGVYVLGKACYESSRVCDGDYVAEDGKGIVSFKWSLAGNELLSLPNSSFTRATAINSDGGVIVGTKGRSDTHYSPPTVDVFGRDPYFISDLEDDDGDGRTDDWPPRLQAYRQSSSGEFAEVGRVPDFDLSFAVDVSGDGKVTLLNVSQDFDRYDEFASQAFLWHADGLVQSLGHPSISPIPGSLNRPLPTQRTRATAISADGSNVVGSTQLDSPYDPFPVLCQDCVARNWEPSRAVLWNEERGWTVIDETSLDPLWHDYNYGSTAIDVSSDGSLVLAQTWDVVASQVITNVGIVQFYNFIRWPAIWDEQRGMRDLADVLRLDYGLDLGGWDLREATAISDDGTTIIGNGVNPAGANEAWRAVLYRETRDGDIDFDGDVDRHDYATLMANLGLNSETSSVFYADGDLNGDGLVDEADSAAMLGLYDHRDMGDFNADGLVDLADYTVWRDHVGRFTGGLADSNGDGWVNDLDLAAWRAHFGEAIASLVPFAVPEPGGAVGLLLGVTAIGLRRRR